MRAAASVEDDRRNERGRETEKSREKRERLEGKIRQEEKERERKKGPWGGWWPPAYGEVQENERENMYMGGELGVRE